VEVVVKLGQFELLRRISGFDLFVCEAKYHPSCRKDFNRRPEYWKSKDTEGAEHQLAKEQVHRDAFDKVCVIVTDTVITNHKVVKLSELLDVYIGHLRETLFQNDKYRGTKLKTKLEQCTLYTGLLGFCPIGKDGRFQSYLVFSQQTDVVSAIKNAYELGGIDKVKDVARLIKDNIVSAFKDVDNMPWPPTANDLNQTSVIPKLLEKFLTYLLSGDKAPSRRICRLVISI
jgi:hypothetical protein